MTLTLASSIGTLNTGDRILFEFGYPYNYVLAFRASCVNEDDTSTELYCIPF